MIVEINAPPSGIDRNIQAVFATDKNGCRWLLHQGRMSVAGSKVTQADFIAATGLKPARVVFSDGSKAEYHKVANLSARAAIVQDQMAAFVAQCALARSAKLAKGAALPDLSDVEDWERRFSPEATGEYEIAPRAARTGRRIHADISKALAAELKRRDVPHSNERVLRYGPDLFTFGTGPKVLFEIKSGCGSQDIFAAVGQLHIYDHLLGGNYRKVLVVPKGMGKALEGPVAGLGLHTVEFEKKGSRVTFDGSALGRCLK